MGIKHLMTVAGQKAADKVARAASLSPEQLERIAEQREKYLSEKPDPSDPHAQELTGRLLAASSVEIYNSYLPLLQQLYVPVQHDAEYDTPFAAYHNIRYFRITKWVTDKNENSLEKLVNVYETLSNEDCNIALVFHRRRTKTEVYLAVTNTDNEHDNTSVSTFCSRLESAIKGNFPGSELSETDGAGIIPCLDNDTHYSVATATNIPTEKSEKFKSQTIEKLIDGIVPETSAQEYTLILLATPVHDVEERKLRLGDFYSGLTPYASWQTSFTYDEHAATSSSATFGLNVGASAGIQNGQNSSVTNSKGVTDSENNAETQGDAESASHQSGQSESKTSGETKTDSQTLTQGSSSSQTATDSSGTAKGKSSSDSTNKSANINAGVTVGAGANSSINSSLGVPSVASLGGSVGKNIFGAFNVSTGKSHGTGHTETASSQETLSHSDAVTEARNRALAQGKSLAKNEAETVAKSVSDTATKTFNHALTRTLGRAVTSTVANTSGIFKALNLGVNFGANFARSSTITATIGKNEGITQSFSNYNIKHTLELLEQQMKRYEKSTALGMWDFAAYVMSEDMITANNVAHSYIALTEGEESFMSRSAVNLWRGDTGEQGNAAEEICMYLRELRHPVFGLNPDLSESAPALNIYPPTVTATTSLSGKELAYSLNFPQKSIAGLPVFECAEFGRNIATYDPAKRSDSTFDLGHIFHMNHEENTPVELSSRSLTSHVFITGSTGSGKSNTVYQLLGEAQRENIHFMVIEPAKGEYKSVFGNEEDVNVYGTNPSVSPLLRLNPFSFPEGVHVFEHMDRLVEIFNVCWPMYAAMPAVLKAAIEKSYADCGWDLTASENKYGEDLFPSFADVARNIRTIIDSSEYDAENKGAYKGSLLTRLQSLTNGINGLIFTQNELSEKELFDENTIVDLSRVGSSETKSLLMGVLVMKLQEYRMTSGRMNAPLRHLTVLEEAHNLLKRTSTEQPVEGGNLLGKSVEMISNAIAEMRTYGEGFIIVDQAPGLLDMAAIRNTNTKIIMRLPDEDDRKLVGKAANLNDDQIQELAKLPCGVGAVYQNEWIQPVLCKITHYKTDEQPYRYERQPVARKDIDPQESLSIAALLSAGTKLDEETILRDIRPKMKELRVDASVEVAVYHMLLNPAREPRMTKLGFIMAQLFPMVVEAVRDSYRSSSVPEDWTISAETALRSVINGQIDDQVRRDIVQGIITYYFLNEVNNEQLLRDWRKNGGLR